MEKKLKTESVVAEESQLELKDISPVWGLDKTSGLLHVDCQGQQGEIEVEVNGSKIGQQVYKTTLEGGKASIQLSGWTEGGELFIAVRKLS